MSKTDISQLAGESLADGTFPSASRSAFRVFFAPSAHEAIHAHGSEDTSVEICGVLVGQWQQDDDGPFAAVTEIIRCDDATKGQAEVTFTHESWNHINSEMDSKYQDLRIVGWYHTHPDFGIFLSDRDTFIQEHFFGGPGQVALVVDPIRKLEGVFEWREGKPTLMDHYWVGDRIESVAASRTQESTRLVNRPESIGAATANVVTAAGPAQRDSLTTTTTLLSWLCLFLLGWLLSGMSNNSEAYQNWAVQRYGLWNIMQLGRNDQIRLVRAELAQVAADVKTLSSEHLTAAGQSEAEDADETAKELRGRWKSTRERLLTAERALERINTVYALTPEQERLALAAVVNELRSLRMSDLQMAVPVPVPEKVLEQILAPPPEKSGQGTAEESPAEEKQTEPDADNQTTRKPAGPPLEGEASE